MSFIIKNNTDGCRRELRRCANSIHSVIIELMKIQTYKSKTGMQRKITLSLKMH